MAENKTRPTTISVAAFLRKSATGRQLEDCQELVKLFKELTGMPARMWGPSIVGFGSYHYVYPSGREGDAPLVGFSPRKPKTVLYLLPGCVYVKTLDDIDRAWLEKTARATIAALRKKYPAKR